MTDVARAEGAAVQRLVRERFIWRFRIAALAFAVVQSAVEPGDDVTLTWVNVALFGASVLWTGLALRGRDPSAHEVRRVGVVAMATDVAVILLILANNLTDLSEPIYLIGVLGLLEATIRWPGRGGVVGGVAAGLTAGVWTVVVAHRTVDRWHVDYASMRAGIIVVLGIFLGAILRRTAEQHEMLRGILDTTRDLIVVLAADGTILSINAASTSMLGYSPGEMVGEHFSRFLHPEDLRKAPGSPLDLPTDGPRLIERRALCRDGSSRWLELNTAAIPGGTTMHVAARDITDRVEARRLVEESEQRFRSLFEHNTDAVFAFDLDGRFSMVNPATEAVTGFSAEELIGSSFVPLIHADDLTSRRSGHFRGPPRGRPGLRGPGAGQRQADARPRRDQHAHRHRRRDRRRLRAGQGRHRSSSPRAPARPPGHPRRPHRAAEPVPAGGRPRGGRVGLGDRPNACSSSTSTGSSS